MARHDDLPVPVYKSLEPVYGSGSQLEEAELRFNKLKSKFVEFFGHSPDIYARSPGIVSVQASYSLFLCFQFDLAKGCFSLTLDFACPVSFLAFSLDFDERNYVIGFGNHVATD